MNTLVIWLKDGKTLYFENVVVLDHTDDDTLWFKYHGKSTDVTRVANFKKSELLGTAINENYKED